MNGKLAPALVILAMALSTATQTYGESGRIYGQVYTQDDEIYEGRIRWDDHETFWDDILDATKSGSPRGEGTSRQVQRRIEVLGIKISWTEDEKADGHRRFGIRMGRLRSIKRRSRDSAVLELKDGSRIRVVGSGTDIGSANRGIVIDDQEVGRITIDWSDFEKAVFSPEPVTEVQNQEEWRLHGTVTAWDGREFRGFIIWDNDESLSSDVLDGESRGEGLEIPFSKITAIERKSSSSAMVELTSGKKIRLRDSNDVNEENRGIVIKVPHYGKVTVDWNDFERIVFDRPAAADLRSYDYFDAGEALYGVVWDDLGEQYRGRIRWDDDEAMTYEFLDGQLDEISVMIEFGDIKAIQRRSSSSATVKLKSGESLTLKGTCDVNEENRGIVVESDDGEVIRLSWDEFERVEFARP
jgi:hypothetical protein